MKSEVRAFDLSHLHMRVDSRKFDNISSVSKLHRLVVILISSSMSNLHVSKLCLREVFRVYQHEYLSFRLKFEATDSLCFPEMSSMLPLRTWHSEMLELQHLLMSDLVLYPVLDFVLKTELYVQDTRTRGVSFLFYLRICIRARVV